MIKHVIIPFTAPGVLDEKIAQLEAAGWLPTAVGHIAASDGPGALLYVLVQTDIADDAVHPDPSGNGHDTELPAPELVPAPGA